MCGILAYLTCQSEYVHSYLKTEEDQPPNRNNFYSFRLLISNSLLSMDVLSRNRYSCCAHLSNNFRMMFCYSLQFIN
jgi:hypothetical protein